MTEYAIQHRLSGLYWVGLTKAGGDLWGSAEEAKRFPVYVDAIYGGVKVVNARPWEWRVAGLPVREPALEAQ